MTKRLILAGVVAAMGVLVLAAVGSGGVRAAKEARPLPASSCGPLSFTPTGQGDTAQFILASDLPLQGASRTQTIEMTKAVNFVLANAHYKAGKYNVGYQSCDDSTAQAGKWDSAKCSANANAYAQNGDVIGVVGTFNSGCAAIEIPILNRATNGPIAIVSPANTYVGLTSSGPGTAAGEPNKYYPTGKRNYARVVAHDAYQGAADAILAKQLGVKKLYVLNDKEAYGLGVATNMENASKKLGIQVVGSESYDPKASSYEALATKIQTSGATGVFVGGLICENGAKLVKDLRGTLGADVKLILPDGFSPTASLIQQAGAAAEGVTISVAGPPVSKLTGAGKAFVAAFKKQFKKEPFPYTAYAAQAATALLAAVAKSDGTRPGVVKALFQLNLRNSLMGNIRFNSEGDVVGGPVTVYGAKGGKEIIVKVISPPQSLVKSA